MAGPSQSSAPHFSREPWRSTGRSRGSSCRCGPGRTCWRTGPGAHRQSRWSTRARRRPPHRAGVPPGPMWPTRSRPPRRRVHPGRHAVECPRPSRARDGGSSRGEPLVTTAVGGRRGQRDPERALDAGVRTDDVAQCRSRTGGPSSARRSRPRPARAGCRPAGRGRGTAREVEACAEAVGSLGAQADDLAPSDHVGERLTRVRDVPVDLGLHLDARERGVLRASSRAPAGGSNPSRAGRCRPRGGWPARRRRRRGPSATRSSL